MVGVVSCLCNCPYNMVCSRKGIPVVRTMTSASSVAVMKPISVALVIAFFLTFIVPIIPRAIRTEARTVLQRAKGGVLLPEGRDYSCKEGFAIVRTETSAPWTVPVFCTHEFGYVGILLLRHDGGCWWILSSSSINPNSDELHSISSSAILLRFVIILENNLCSRS